MRALALSLAALLGLGGCVYDPYYGYAYYPQGDFVAGAVVGAAGALVLTDPDLWPYHGGGYHYRYPSYRYYPGGYSRGRSYAYRPYHRGRHWHR